MKELEILKDYFIILAKTSFIGEFMKKTVLVLVAAFALSSLAFAEEGMNEMPKHHKKAHKGHHGKMHKEKMEHMKKEGHDMDMNKGAGQEGTTEKSE